MTDEFNEIIKKHQTSFGLNIDNTQIESLTFFRNLVTAANPILHLTAPGSTEEFVIRHILESLTLLPYLPENARFADVGAGAGLPSVPCLLVREDLQAVLIEAKLKKADFLQNAAEKCGLSKRVEIINRQFEEIPKPDVSFVTCRALDKFTAKLPKLLKWSQDSSLLFFGGPNLREALKKHGLEFSEKLIPQSEQRFLFYIKNKRY
jgi:16S rRNA (guanine527-N7)-methyltransferase